MAQIGPSGIRSDIIQHTMHRAIVISIFSLAVYLTVTPLDAQSGSWVRVSTKGTPTARHEAAFVEVSGKLYLLGGRGMKPVDIFDPQSNGWSTASGPPVEMHHFQPVVHDGRIVAASVFTGGYPHETPLPNVMIYDPASDEWSEGPAIPEGRRRGAAGEVLDGDKLYLVGGIIDGHYAGTVPWLDVLDLNTGKWTQLPDAPQARDHFQAALIGGKIYAAAGRRTSAKTNETFTLTVPETDVFDIESQTWSTVAPIPTMRAGTSSLALNGKLVVAGGESGAHETAHAEVEVFDPAAGTWRSLPNLVQGRHGTGMTYFDGKLWTAAGSGNRGGRPELDTLEALSAR